MKDKFIEIFKGLNVAYGKFVPGGKTRQAKSKARPTPLGAQAEYQKNYGSNI